MSSDDLRSNPGDNPELSTDADTSPTADNGRRRFLKLSAGGSAAALAASVAPAANAADDPSPALTVPRAAARAREAARIKVAAATQHLRDTLSMQRQLINGDERRYRNDNYYASFTKCLPSNEFGEADPSAFEALVRALTTGRTSRFADIPLDATAARGLANPQGSLKFEPAALDGHATRLPASHQFRSAELAGEMAEVYWQALVRDVPFADYDTDAGVAMAVADLNAMSAPPGDRMATPGNLFRGETPGDLIGPYISQFLIRDFNFGPAANVQRYSAPNAGENFMIDQANWLNVQRGGAPAETQGFDAIPRYIYNNRTLGEYVHSDVLYQAYLNACLILLSFGSDAFDSGNPYPLANQGGFTALGGPMVLDMVTKAANLSLTGAWFQKWQAHRFLRPEALGGRVQFHLTGQRTYEIHPDLLNTTAVAEVGSRNGNHFLPMAYVEGSPTHPSYPAGHATIAGACCTVLKAYFDESFEIPNPQVPDSMGLNLNAYGGTLTVGNELNKLANNVAIGRDAAGVHYRQDGVYGLLGGEQQAIALLQDQSRTLNESDFDGWTLTKFDGETINIRKGRVTSV